MFLPYERLLWPRRFVLPDLLDRGRRLRLDDAGMSTAEYAIGTIAAAALAALLYTVLTGDDVATALSSLVERALSVKF